MKSIAATRQGYHVDIPRSVFTLMPAALPLLSRSPTATIAGIVRDAQGPIIPNVRVTATSGAARQKTTSATNENGLFSFPQLPIGQYAVDAEKSGFRRFARNGLVLITGQDLELDIVLEAGVVSESVTISGTATLLETRTSDPQARTLRTPHRQRSPSGRPGHGAGTGSPASEEGVK